MLKQIDVLVNTPGLPVQEAPPPPPLQNRTNNYNNQNGPTKKTSQTKSTTTQVPPNQSTITSWMGGGNTNNTTNVQNIPNNRPNSLGSSGNTSVSTDNGRTPDTQICNCNREAVVLTCRNGANAGRQFYKCPLNNQTGTGGCKYFAWKDEDQTPNTSNAGSYQPPANGNNNGDDSDDAGQPAQCQCGMPAAMRTVSKDGANKGRQFYSCPKPMGQGCKFFEWADEVSTLKSNTCNIFISIILIGQ